MTYTQLAVLGVLIAIILEISFTFLILGKFLLNFIDLI